MGDAHNVFDAMSQWDVVLWNDIIAGCIQNGLADEALLLFDRMKESGMEPDHFILVGILTPCADLAALKQGKKNQGEVDSLDISMTFLLAVLLWTCMQSAGL